MGRTTVKHRSIHTGYRGYSLIELMVALTIGLIILAAVSALFVGSKKGYTTQDRLARLQENARFAMQFLIKDLRLAGYYGCVNGLGNVNNWVNGPASFAYNASNPVEGFDGGTGTGTGTWFPSNVATAPADRFGNSDMVMVRMADPGLAVNLSTDMPRTSANLDVTSTEGFNEGDIIILTDCASADIMQVTAEPSGGMLQHAPGSAHVPGNSRQQLSKKYSTTGSQIMSFVSRQYYIGTGASGNPALFRITNSGGAEELVDGIEDLQILYGMDTDSTDDGNGKMANVYRRAGDAGLQSATDWSRVVSVRIGILARTLTQEDTDIDSSTYDVDGDGNNTNNFTAPGNDRHKRRVFSATVQLRNLI